MCNASPASHVREETECLLWLYVHLSSPHVSQLFTSPGLLLCYETSEEPLKQKLDAQKSKISTVLSFIEVCQASHDVSRGAFYSLGPRL